LYQSVSTLAFRI